MSIAKLHPRLQEFVKEKWKALSPIQVAAFDPIFNGVSCTVEAPTSGGKTEAVLFPLLTRIAPNKSQGFKVLYIAPLKALLNDLSLRIEPYAQMCYLEAFKWHGDVNQSEKINQMRFPSDILMTTPESLEAILLRKANWQEVFSALETIVVDEAHYFAQTERGSHLLAILERIEANLKRRTQRIAVTATIGNPQELRGWMAGPNGISIKTENLKQKERDFMVHYFSDTDTSLHDRLYQLLQQKKTIVFDRSRSDTESTATEINKRNNGLRFRVEVRTHHSSVGKRMREDAENSIKSKGESALNAIIATSTLELGIDIGDLDQVVQIGGLTSSGSFLQRVGRTGRRQERKQVFRGLCSDAQELLLLTGCIKLGLRQEAEPIPFPEKAFHILAHQIICFILQRGGASIEQIANTLLPAACFRKITPAELKQLINYMIEQDWLRMADGHSLLTSDKTEKTFLRSNWRRLFAIFDTGPMYEVMDGKKQIGTLDSAFVKSLNEPPLIFVLGGIEWLALEIDHERQLVKVKKNDSGIAPKWKAIAGFDVPFELAQEIGHILMTDEHYPFLDANASHALEGQRSVFENLGWIRLGAVFDQAMDGGKIFVWTFAGDKANRALAHLLTASLKKKCSYDYMNVQLEKTDGLNITNIQDHIFDLLRNSNEALEQLLETNMKVVWFSKFSDCLPAELAKKALLEKIYDLPNLRKLAL